jgi:hypothetical protein
MSNMKHNFMFFHFISTTMGPPKSGANFHFFNYYWDPSDFFIGLEHHLVISLIGRRFRKNERR